MKIPEMPGDAQMSCFTVSSKSNQMNAVNGGVRGRTKEQRDLGIQIKRSLKLAAQVFRALKRALRILAFISQGKGDKTRAILILLYKTLYRTKCWSNLEW